MSKTYRSSTERMAEIVDILSSEGIGKHGLTAHGIAKRLGLVPSHHVRGLLREAQKLGWLEAQEVQHRPGLTKTIWTVSANGREMLPFFYRVYLAPIQQRML